MNPHINKETRAELHNWFDSMEGKLNAGEAAMLSQKFGLHPDTIYAEFDAWEANEKRKAQPWIIAALVAVFLGW